ncbi:hypothetical protein HS088_TW12G00703 [Tripterygium wilfordii]|uniref:Uncharacterized protein n=1 Tax=Tripterygium wilfordii TaxID=458696 RepID=A0A7J7CZI2_TRIWF|nr:uncharacterized protein LOC120010045 [Tripterygium wilfordii]KAF5739497.1 hypothetical protein HS088_TW12G00703 [Tripterygium wilfordii]
MDQRECKFQSLGICNKVYIFLMRILTRQALKTDTLGNANPNSHNDPAGYDPRVHPVVQETPCEGPVSEAEVEPEQQKNNVKDLESVGNGKGAEEESAQTKAPKKTVSINERVEEIDTKRKMIKRKKSKSADLNLGSSDDEPKHLKSILKVGSNLDDNLISY